MVPSQLFNPKTSDTKTVLLYRFHIVAIIINLFATFIDGYLQRYTNALIESSVVVLLLVSLWYLYRFERVKFSAYLFILTISSALFTLIYISHFATMSVVFILLLPLTTLIFLSLKESLLLTILYVITTASLLYLEHLNNPANPLAHNFNALFNLAYTAIIIYVFGLLYHFSILRTFNELDETNHQNVLLLKEVHHRVKNNLNMIAAIVGLHSNTLEGKEQEEMLKTQNRIESIAIVHEMLYRHDNFAQINFELYMKQLSNLLLSTYATDKQISIHIESHTKYLPLEIMVQLGIMVNEFITNSIKYAFPSNEGKIDITLSHTEEGYLLVYQDNGIGHATPEALLKHKSLGIKLINLTAKQLKGSVETSSPSGLKFEVRF